MGGQIEPKFMMRLPGSLHSRIKSAAKANGRSMNGELVRALELAFPKPVEPESVNERLADASRTVLETWSDMLTAIGQDPTANPQLAELRAAIAKAGAA